MENELEKVLKSKFFSSAGFAQEIETLVQVNKDMNYIDAIIHFCEKIVLMLNQFLNLFLNL